MWSDQAACRGTDWQQFFPAVEHRDATEVLRPVAEATCAHCPVLAACASWADRYREAGLWGGVYRATRESRYTRSAILEGAPMGELPPKAPGAGVAAWVA